jgi:hypothetical protein
MPSSRQGSADRARAATLKEFRINPDHPAQSKDGLRK